MRLVITGMGAITPLGNSVDEYWDNLVAGKCGINEITRFDTSELPVKVAGEIKDFEPSEHMPKKLTREMDPFMQYGFAAAMQAIDQAGEAAEPDRMGIVVGTALGGINHISETQDVLSKGIRSKVSPRFVPKIIGNEAAAQVAIAKGYRGPSLTVSTACSSGGDAIGTACMLIQAGQADAVVAMGTESALSPIFILGLTSAHALSTNPDPAKASRPFDRDRDGFVIGEGGGALVIETEENAKKRGAKIIAEIAGFSNCTDGYHVTSPHPEGIGAIFCMEKAVENAGIKPEDVDYINTHGTSTPVGDPIETSAIVKVFGDHTSDMYVTSSKGATGHMMAAGGITEAITCIKAIETGIVPPTINLDNLDEKCEKLNYAPNKAVEKQVNVAMSNSFGFGGQNSSVIFKKYE
ncbi:beta-ketoacyl-ACP synthase II [Eubacterium xylanophilum]|uniref:beta-ketoacyl-ACP synthase II n=1 Tax=Eubacterium xylanophilum TaxID=39497 RepID=UPI0004B708F0|nr:beta-ketoacyl-ACP synthase II [Eubacterium xylanophilum]